jgi:hypothetical protein
LITGGTPPAAWQLTPVPQLAGLSAVTTSFLNVIVHPAGGAAGGPHFGPLVVVPPEEEDPA